MTDVEYDAILAEAFRLINEVAAPTINGRENALEVLKRMTGMDHKISLMLIVRGLEAAKGIIDETTEVCAYFMLLGAILALDHDRRQRVISIEKAKRALPDYVLATEEQKAPAAEILKAQFEDGGTCPKCGGSWYGRPTCPRCEATPVSPTASESER